MKTPIYYLGLTKEATVSEFISFCKKEVQEKLADDIVTDIFMLTTSFSSYDVEENIGDLLENEVAYVFARTTDRIYIVDVVNAEMGDYMRCISPEKTSVAFNTLKSLSGILDTVNKYYGGNSKINVVPMNDSNESSDDIDVGCQISVNHRDLDIIFKTQSGKKFNAALYRAEDRVFRIFSEGSAELY